MRVVVKSWDLDDEPGIGSANTYLREPRRRRRHRRTVGPRDRLDYIDPDYIAGEQAVEAMRDYLGEQYPWIDEWLTHGLPSFTVNHGDLVAWVRSHPPYPAAQLHEN